MRLESGLITSDPGIDEDIADFTLYTCPVDEKKKVTFIQLNNETAGTVIVNLFLEYADSPTRIRMLPLNTSLVPNNLVMFTDLEYFLEPDSKIVIKADTNNAVTYLINGEDYN